MSKAGSLRRTSRNRRVRNNALCKRSVLAADTRPTKRPKSREQWVIECVARCVGTRANVITADDIASDIILHLLDAGGFNWEDVEIEAFCRKRVSGMLISMLGRREMPECEFKGADGERIDIAHIAGTVKPHQEIHLHAQDARGLLKAIPDAQRHAMEILCDGGNPLDIAADLSVTPWQAITLIKEAREYITRVDPI